MTEENYFTLLLNAVCLVFLDYKFLLQLFFNHEDFCLFPDPFLTFQNGTTFYWYADWVKTVLHWVCFFTEDRCIGSTKIWAVTAWKACCQDSHCKNTLCVTTLSKIRDSDQKLKDTENFASSRNLFCVLTN